MVVVAILHISGETFKARGEVGKGGRRHNGEVALALLFVLIFGDHVHDRGEDAGVAPAAHTPKAETRAGGGDTARGFVTG